MPGIDDFFAYESTKGDSTGGCSADGCAMPSLWWIIALIAIIMLIGKCAG